MKSVKTIPRLLLCALCLWLAVLPMGAVAEDIDIFVTDGSPPTTFDNPNVLIVLDNTSNWARADQKWPADPDTGLAQKQGEAELQAIKAVVDTLTSSINVGLMLFTDTGSGREGGYIRFPVVQMTAANKTAFQNLVQYIYDNFSSPSEKTSSSANYSAVMFDVFKYFGGWTSPANVTTGTQPGSPVGATGFGPMVFNQRTDATLAAVPGALAAIPTNNECDPAHADYSPATCLGLGGYTDGSRSPLATPTTYRPPISGKNFCAKNFIIFIGNGFPNSDKGGPVDTVARMDQYLAAIGGNTTQLAVPGFTTTNVTTNTPIDYTSACYATQGACTTTDFASQCGAGLTYETCSCSGTSKTTMDACPSGQSRYQVLGTTNTPGTTTGPTAGAPFDATAPTSACYATAAAAASAVSAGTEKGGLDNPATTTTGIAPNPVTTTSYSSTWSVNATAVSPNTCAYGTAGTAVATDSGDTSACYGNKNDYVSTDHGGLTCPADTATTHYVCTYALKANPNNGTNCAGGKQYAVTQTATPYPINYKYTVTRTSTPSATTETGAATATTVLGNTFACYASAPSGTPTEFSPSCPSGSTCSVSYGSTTTAAACPSGARYLVQGNATTATVVSNNTFAVPDTNKLRMTDEWARYLYQTDANVSPGTPASPLPGQQNISTYTIDVFNAKQDGDQTALLMSMARVGGGKYFAAKNKSQIVTALLSIMSEIQAVNTVFASASLPVNATNRAQNENQVFIGMFRPDKTPRWYGNIKRYILSNFDGAIDLGDSQTPPLRAVNLQTGFISECAISWWTTDSGTYWQNVPSNPPAETKCSTTTSLYSTWSDIPDGPLVEKGAAAEVIRKGNLPGTVDWDPLRRTVKTLDGSNALVNFTASSSGLTATLGAGTLADFILGKDVNNENGNGLFATETRASLHGDVVHSRPLPVNYATAANPTAGVTVYYGANDGTLRAINASTGQERWAFVAPEFFSSSTKFARMGDPSGTEIKFPSSTASASERKDYYWDGSVGIYQNLDNTKVWIFPAMRRGGRMIYAFNVTDPDNPVFKWKLGCPNLTDNTGCSSPDGTDVSGIGQTWSLPSVAFIKGYSTTRPVIVVGGGYDPCEDADSSSPSCPGTPAMGNKVYVIDADDGSVIETFSTARSVASDVVMVDADNDTYVDYVYVGDTGGNLYRLDFVDGAASFTTLAPADWAKYRVAYTDGTYTKPDASTATKPRKFFYPPAVFYTGGRVYVALGTGDREHPLAGDYPFAEVRNRFYVYLDTLADKPADAASVWLDDASLLNDNTSANSCLSDKVLASCSASDPLCKRGWFMDLNQYGTQDSNGLTGEQTVTSALILGGLVTFSTNRPIPPAASSCTTTLGEARGYWVNLLNGSGGIGTPLTATCGGERAAAFVGGGLPPSPVTGSVPIDGVVRTVVIGAVQRDGSASAPIGGQKVVPSIRPVRKRVYWFKNIDN